MSSAGHARLAARLHVIVAALVVVGLPALSLSTGEGGLAFAMFSGSRSFRLRATVVDQAGESRAVPATALAARAGGSVGDVLAGSERWRFSPYGRLVRTRLEQVAALACRARGGSRAATVRLDERRTLDAPVVTTSASVACPPPSP
jgi:hypothetical protein